MKLFVGRVQPLRGIGVMISNFHWRRSQQRIVPSGVYNDYSYPFSYEIGLYARRFHFLFAMETLLAENAALRDAPSDHVAEGGWYSAEVLATPLQTVAMQRFDRAMWEMPLMPVTRPDEVRTA